MTNISTEDIKNAILLLADDAEARSLKPGHEKYYRNRAEAFREVITLIEKMETTAEQDDTSIKELTCPDCPYYWKNEDEDYPGCHFEARCPEDVAPCEESDYDDSYYDEGGDLYESE